MLIEIEIYGARERATELNPLIKKFVEGLKKLNFDIAGYTQIPKIKEE